MLVSTCSIKEAWWWWWWWWWWWTAWSAVVMKWCAGLCVCQLVVMWQRSGWTSEVPGGSVLHSSREMPMHRLPAAEAAGGARSRTKWWTASSHPVVLWSLPVWQSCARQPCHCCWHLLHQKVIRHNTCELFYLFLLAFLLPARFSHWLFLQYLAGFHQENKTDLVEFCSFA